MENAPWNFPAEVKRVSPHRFKSPSPRPAAEELSVSFRSPLFGMPLDMEAETAEAHQVLGPGLSMTSDIMPATSRPGSSWLRSSAASPTLSAHGRCQAPAAANLCGLFQSGNCSWKCPNGLRHQCCHCLGPHAGTKCRRPLKEDPLRDVKRAEQFLRHRRLAVTATRAPEQDDEELPRINGTMDGSYRCRDQLQRASLAAKTMAALLAKLCEVPELFESPQLSSLRGEMLEVPKEGEVPQEQEEVPQEQGKVPQEQGGEVPQGEMHLPQDALVPDGPSPGFDPPVPPKNAGLKPEPPRIDPNVISVHAEPGPMLFPKGPAGVLPNFRRRRAPNSVR